MTLTSVTRGLEGVATERPPADGEDVTRVVATPVVERPSPAVKRHVDLVVVDVTDRRGTDELWVLVVHSLQLSAALECVRRGRWWGLHGEKHYVVDSQTDRVHNFYTALCLLYLFHLI